MNRQVNLLGSVLALAGLTGAALAQAGDLVVIMAPGAAALSKDQVANVYIGRNKDLKPYDLPESASERTEFYRKATDRDLSQVKALWTRLTFTGEGTPPKELADDAAVKKAVAADPKAIGYVSKASVDSTVKVVLELN